MLLTDEEIYATWGMAKNEAYSFREFARAIESSVLEKLKAQEPVGVFADVNRLTPEAGTRWEHMVDEAYDGKEYIHLYRYPLPPADVVRDAERYRWLREVAPNIFWDSHDKEIGFVKFDTKAYLWKPEVFDAAIDAAMKEMK